MSDKKRSIDPENKVELVVSAARSLFVKRGYYRVTIPDIVKQSGVSTGAIYSYFENKESLARHIQQETLAEFHQMFLERLKGKEGTYSKLRAFAELIFDLCESDPDMLEYLFFMKHAEFLPGNPPMCFSPSLRLLQAIVAEGINAGELKPATPFISAVAFTGVILRAAELRIMCVLETPLCELSEELISDAWAAIKP